MLLVVIGRYRSSSPPGEMVYAVSGDGNTDALPRRLAARVIVLDPAGAVLLMRYDHGPPNGRHWSTPGGGLEPGEDFAQAGLRELREETGWTENVALADEVLRRDLVMEYAGRLVRQHERMFLARIPDVRSALGDVAAMHRADQIAAWRWWTVDELDMTDEVVWPTELPTLIRRALENA